MSDPSEPTPYRVLARKYRPSRFSELIGQEAMVRTLTNAMAVDRLAQAFILTGVRGVGKTTTARIIARALNCTGADGTGGPTAEPCGECDNCTAIAADRHVDVIEMDAASRTGVDDIRDVIEGVMYRPVMARRKIYIIDEVHMLSRNAFNALLKTLEEPPEHVTFIFATTEIRKVPVTVLSRCQRFDLRRVEAERLMPHLGTIAEAERARLTEAGLRLIARAADGSVRDGLSLLDQAIAHAGTGEITEDMVRDMLGLADGGRVHDLFDALMKGEIGPALDIADELNAAGADPALIVHDLLSLSHRLTRLKLAPGTADDISVSETERVRGAAMAEALSMPVLSRAWQMLLKGLDEVRMAPAPVQALEMVLVRLAYAGTLPTPDEIARLAAGGGNGAAAPLPPADPAGQAAPPADGAPEAPQQTSPDSFADTVALFSQHREAMLHAHLQNNVNLVLFEPGRIEFRPGAHAPPDLARQVAERLREWTGRDWQVLARDDGAAEPTLHETAENERAARRQAAIDHPDVQAALAAFPGAEVESVRERDMADADMPDDPDSEFSEGDGQQ